MSRSFNIAARKARNLHCPFHHRWSNLRFCMNCMTIGSIGFSFQELESALTAKFGIHWDGPPYLGTEQQLMDAVFFLEVERNKQLEKQRASQRKRIREKVQGKRQPSRADVEALNDPVLLVLPEK